MLISFIVYLMIRCVQGILYFLPRKLCLFTGKGLGLLAYYVVRNKQKVVRENLIATDIGKDLTLKQIKELTKKIFMNFGITVVEVLVISKYKKQWKSFIKIPDKDFKEFSQITKNGAILYLSHFNNWEIFTVFCHDLEKKVLTVGQKIKNLFLDQWIKKSREKNGVYLSSKKGFIKEALNFLEQGQIVALLADQNAGNHGIPMEFLGKKASTFTTAEVLALKTKKPIISIFDMRDFKTGGHYICMAKPIYSQEILKEHQEDKEVSINILTQKNLHELEEKIKQSPESWFWLHKRWKK